MAVVAKFFVSEIVRHDGRPTADRVSLGAVCRGAQNAKWASSTPNGRIELSILNDAATEYFTEGEEYEVVFTHAPKPQRGDGHAPVPDWSPWQDRSFPPTQCGICGMYAEPNEDGSLDWTQHQATYGA